MEKSGRQIGFDNIKGILIILVVFGHFLELCPNTPFSRTVYMLIYSFHMPAFLFISGFHARYRPRKLRYYACVYGFFQILYRLFARIVLGVPNSFALIQILMTPYWLLWFLPVLIYCHLLLPIFEKARQPLQLILLGTSVLISLLAGYCPQIGYPLSLSRFLVFLPFFLAGKLARACAPQFQSPHILLLIFLTVCSSVILCRSNQVNPQMLYGSFPYSIGYSPSIRLGILLHGAIWTMTLLALATTFLNRPLPFLSQIGKYTFPIYLLHGFIVNCIDQCFTTISVTTALFCSAAVVILLGNPAADKPISLIFRIKK